MEETKDTNDPETEFRRLGPGLDPSSWVFISGKQGLSPIGNKALHGGGKLPEGIIFLE